ncbi:hypothetical protein C3L33_13625, partial [Rhododendron williamsianum]
MKNMCGSTLNIISDLPDTIIEKILVLMPIRDAVRTSVLSKNWRFNWINIPVLAFDDTSLVDPYRLSFANYCHQTNSQLRTDFWLLYTMFYYFTAAQYLSVVEGGGGKFDWAGLLDGLPVLRSLHMDGPYLMSMFEEVCLGQVGQRLPTLWHLNILELSDVRLGKRVVGMILKLIRHSPKLHKVIIKLEWHLNYLREVEMRLVSGTKIELHFMKLLLAKSRVLESMVVKPNPAK